MKQLSIFFTALLLIGAGVIGVGLSSCEERECPEGMVECSTGDGREVCVPDHIGC